jgi:hypothetical protein
MVFASIKHLKKSREDCQMVRKGILFTENSHEKKEKNDNINYGCTIQAFISTYPTYNRYL